MSVLDGENIVYIPAKDIKIGDIVAGVKWDELTSEIDEDPSVWSSKSITEMTVVPTTITNIIPSVKDITMYFNGDMSKRFSLEHTVLVKRNDVYMFITTGTVEVGDIIIEKIENEGFAEKTVESINTIDETRDVYQLDASPVDVLIAGDIVVHNLKMY